VGFALDNINMEEQYIREKMALHGNLGDE